MIRRKERGAKSKGNSSRGRRFFYYVLWKKKSVRDSQENQGYRNSGNQMDQGVREKAFKKQMFTLQNCI